MYITRDASTLLVIFSAFKLVIVVVSHKQFLSRMMNWLDCLVDLHSRERNRYIYKTDLGCGGRHQFTIIFYCWILKCTPPVSSSKFNTLFTSSNFEIVPEKTCVLSTC